jgi:cullin 1
LEQQRISDLSRAFHLMSRIANGLEPLKETFEIYVKKSGLAAMEKLANKSGDPDPKEYVDALLEVHNLYLQMVANAFRNDAGFSGALDKACREFVNRNALCKQSSSKSPEHLAKYSDALLKKSSKASSEESDVDLCMNNIMIVFKYIEDKDVYQKFYSKMLAKRLVYDTSLSEESEELMINKLKEACGYEYTSKLSRMFTDMSLSKDLNDGNSLFPQSCLLC